MNAVQVVLTKKLIEMKKKNPRLSTRYFAQRLGISSGSLSEILKGKRRISKKLAEKLADRLFLTSAERDKFLSYFQSADEIIDINYLQLRDDQFHVISEWHYFAILNLVKSSRCQHKISWFAESLNLSPKVVQESMDRLIRLGLIQFENNHFTRTHAQLMTSDDVLNLSIQKSNLEDLEFIRNQLDFLDVVQRDFTSITMLLDPLKMPEFKKWIRKIQDQFSAKFETTDSETAYRLTMGLFPLRKLKRKETHYEKNFVQI